MSVHPIVQICVQDPLKPTASNSNVFWHGLHSTEHKNKMRCDKYQTNWDLQCINTKVNEVG